ncbi:MAG: YkvA family protein [Rhizobiaceae bacterium]
MGPEALGPEDDGSAQNVRANFWRTLKKGARYIPFSDELVAAYFCALDPQTPRRVRVILLGALAYFVLPLDSIPDFIIALGFSDDLAVLTAAITAVRSYITPAHIKAAQDALKDDTLKDSATK